MKTSNWKTNQRTQNPFFRFDENYLLQCVPLCIYFCQKITQPSKDLIIRFFNILCISYLIVNLLQWSIKEDSNSTLTCSKIFVAAQTHIWVMVLVEKIFNLRPYRILHLFLPIFLALKTRKARKNKWRTLWRTRGTFLAPPIIQTFISAGP